MQTPIIVVTRARKPRVWNPLDWKRLRAERREMQGLASGETFYKNMVSEWLTSR